MEANRDFKEVTEEMGKTEDRNFKAVTDKVIEHILAQPRADDSHELVETLQKLQVGAGFAAPEAVNQIWNDAAIALGKFYGDPPWTSERACLVAAIYNFWQPPVSDEKPAT